MIRSSQLALVTIALALCAAGCRTTAQARRVEKKGFLRDYSQLKEGKGNEPLLFYVKPNVDLSKYDKMLVAPVSLWRKEKDSALDSLSEENRQYLLESFNKALRDHLSKRWTIVEKPGRGVLEIRAAITEAVGSTVVMDQVTTIVPQTAILTTVVGVPLGKAAFTGSAAAEIEIRDSRTRERLFAGVDKRVGRKHLSGVFETWSHVVDSFGVWAEDIREKLDEYRKA